MVGILVLDVGVDLIGVIGRAIVFYCCSAQCGCLHLMAKVLHWGGVWDVFGLGGARVLEFDALLATAID